MSFKSTFGNILEWTGTILSCIPVVGPLIGGNIEGAGAKLAGSAQTADTLAAASAQTAAAIKAAQDSQKAAAAAASGSLSTSAIFAWIQNNLVASLAIAGAAIYFIPKLFKHRR